MRTYNQVVTMQGERLVWGHRRRLEYAWLYAKARHGPGCRFNIVQGQGNATASAGTHSLYGAVDSGTDGTYGLQDHARDRCLFGEQCSFRDWENNEHCHGRDPLARPQSRGLLSQGKEWAAGETGLVGHDPIEDYQRTTAAQRAAAVETALDRAAAEFYRARRQLVARGPDGPLADYSLGVLVVQRDLNAWVNADRALLAEDGRMGAQTWARWVSFHRNDTDNPTEDGHPIRGVVERLARDPRVPGHW